jgi:hypothetical protein
MVTAGGESTGTGEGRGVGSSRRSSRRTVDLEVIATILLAVVTILTAWSAFQSTKWSGVMAIAFSEANAARTESAQAAARVNVEQAVDVGLFTDWIAARSEGNDELADFLEARFRDEFQPAFDAWVAERPLQTPGAPATPFEMDEYQLDEQALATELAMTADARGQAAREANQRGDNYVLTTVLFASVLFFAGISTRFRGRRVQIALLSMAVLVLAAGVTVLATFPVEV